MKALLQSEPSLSDRALTAQLKENGYEISRFLVKELRETLPTLPAKAAASLETDIFSCMIGWDEGLKAQVHQAKAAMSYPPNGLNTLIIGPSGTGKTFLAENMYRYAVKQGFLASNAPFIAFNCADYAENPQLLNSQLFGYVKGAFSGAGESRDGLVSRADGGILFLDEIHRLSSEGQEMLFYLLDKGAYRRLGDSGPARKVSVRLIAATTSSPESALLLTFRRRIPIVISMPALVDRPLAERFAVINGIFSKEQEKIDRRLIVEADTVRTLLQYDCPGNIGQLQSDIQVCCASAFLESLSRQDGVVYIRSELVEHLLSAGLVPRPLEIESWYCHQLTFPLQEDQEPEGMPGLDTIYDQMRQTMEESVDANALLSEVTTNGKYEITPEMKAQLNDFYGNYADGDETAGTIRALYEKTGYIIDTHTAVATAVWEKYRKDTGDTATKTVIVSTASPFKFTRSVMGAIDSRYDAMSDFELADELGRIGNRKVPAAIEEIRNAAVLHDTVCGTDEMRQTVKKILGLPADEA